MLIIENEMTYNEREEEAQRRNASLGSVPAYCLYYANNIPKSRKKCEEWWNTVGHTSVDSHADEDVPEYDYSDYEYPESDYECGQWCYAFSDDSDE